MFNPASPRQGLFSGVVVLLATLHEVQPVSVKAAAITLVLNGVAPAPTGSRIHGLPFSLAALAANCMPSVQSGVSVPTFTSRAEASLLKSSTSCAECAWPSAHWRQ